jgi:hypothetical protein
LLSLESYFFEVFAPTAFWFQSGFLISESPL